MFGIGYQEMFIVLVVAMIIFGPSRLPELAGQVGRWVRDFRRMSSDLTGEFEKTFAEVDEVKKSFKREMQGIQDEVEGIGKSARGDLKKTGTKSIAAGKKPVGAAAKAGTAAGASGANPARPATALGKSTSTAKNAAANGALQNAKGGNLEGVASGALPVATKADPLIDVSFFDLDVALIGTKNGSSTVDTASNGDDALSRVRRRRATAAYATRKSA